MHRSMQRSRWTTALCVPSLTALLFAAALGLLSGCASAQAPREYVWTKFVHVDGQPEPVPAEWVSTPEGKFAHSIRIPNPVPKDSGYRTGMSSEEYFKHLCETEAGEFIYKTVENVEGFYFMRPPKRPTDEQLKDRYALEAPEIERIFQVTGPKIEERVASLFISPPWRLYRFIEEPNSASSYGQSFLRAYGYKANLSPMKVDTVANLKSRYGLIWRGVKRPQDRELAIAGGEWLVVDLQTKEVLAVRRQYGRTGTIPYERNKVWWLNAVGCWSEKRPKTLIGVLNQIYEFPAKIIKPVPGEQ